MDTNRYIQFLCSKDKFEELITSQNSDPVWRKVALDYCRPLLISSKNEFTEAVIDESSVLNVFFRNDPSISKFPALVDIANLDAKTNDSLLSRGIVNVQSEYFGRNNGYLYFESELEPSQVVGRYFSDFEKGLIIENGWKSFFSVNQFQKSKKFILPESNSIILNDSYLFDPGERSEEKIKNSIDNLTGLFDALLPRNSKQPFHISILSTWTPKPKIDLSKEKGFDAYFQVLEKRIEGLRNYTIFIDLVLVNNKAKEKRIHKRILISNFYYCSCDKGFNLFKEDGKTIADINDLRVESIFHDLEQPGVVPFETMIIYPVRMTKTFNYVMEETARGEGSNRGWYFSNYPEGKMNRLLSHE